MSEPVAIADQHAAVVAALARAQAEFDAAAARYDARAIAETRQAVAHLAAAAATLGWIARNRAGAIELFTLARPEKMR